jgi:uncharacterized membrane protein
MVYLYIILATVFYGAAIVAFSRGPRGFNPDLFGTIVNLFGMLVPMVLYFGYRMTNKVVVTSPGGWRWALVGGLSIALFTITLTRVFSLGENVSFVTPLVYGGAVLIASLSGVLFFHEKMPVAGLFGALLIVLGIGLVAFATYQKGIA